MSIVDPFVGLDLDALPQTSAVLAAKRALSERAERMLRDAEALREAEEADPDAHIYDPVPYADAVPDPRFYEGTGIGLLYESLGSELEGWRIIAGSDRP